MTNLPDFKRGDRLEAAHLKEIVRRLNKLENIKGSGRIQTRGGQIAYVEGVTSSLGVASGTITARSGTTLGGGTVNFYWRNPSGSLEATGQIETVYNPCAVISDGKYVWAQQDSFGDWYVAPLECEA
jgi:hypothetical protein